MMRCAVLLVFLSCAASQAAAKTAANFPYVQSMQMGVFYARCVPDEEQGTKGTTKIYRVRKEQDELVDSYDWYAPGGVVLAWSPIVGKVAALALRGAPIGEHADQTELSFYLGGQPLASYSSEDLQGWGADVWARGGRHAEFKVIGEEQIPGTNEYVFSIEIKGKKLSFDILTGKEYGSDAPPCQ